jgi:hypothetical protein
MVTMNSMRQQAQPTSAPDSDRAMLDRVYRELVQIHASVAEATNDDPKVVTWTEQELRLLVRELGAYRKQHPLGTTDAG